VGETTGDKQFDLSTREGIFAFHTVACLQPTIIRKLFEANFTLSETKV
jgi:hypothetical protein